MQTRSQQSLTESRIIVPDVMLAIFPHSQEKRKKGKGESFVMAVNGIFDIGGTIIYRQVRLAATEKPLNLLIGRASSTCCRTGLSNIITF